MYFPIRKYVYFSDDALMAIKEGDEDMIGYYKEFLLEPERILKMDVCLLTDAYFKPLTKEQKDFFGVIKKTSLCEEVKEPSRLEKALDKLNSMSHEEYKALYDRN